MVEESLRGSGTGKEGSHGDEGMREPAHLSIGLLLICAHSKVKPIHHRANLGVHLG